MSELLKLICTQRLSRKWYQILWDIHPIYNKGIRLVGNCRKVPLAFKILLTI